jgi:copper(I)-binding protein
MIATARTRSFWVVLCAGLPTVIAAHGVPEPAEVRGAYVPEPPPGQPNAALFMRLKNVGTESLTFSRVQCSLAARCELHAHLHANGKMVMQRLSAVDLKSGGELELRPGGLHVMLIGLKAASRAGDQVELTLLFSNGRSVPVTAVVRDMRQ